MSTGTPITRLACPHLLSGRTRCPTTDELERYAHSDLPPLQAMAVYEQIERCSTCRMVVEEHMERPGLPPPDADNVLGQAAVAVLVEGANASTTAWRTWGHDVLSRSFGGLWDLSPDGDAALGVVPVGTGRFLASRPPADPERLRQLLAILTAEQSRALAGCRVHVTVALGRANLDSLAVEDALTGAAAPLDQRPAGLWVSAEALELLAGEPRRPRFGPAVDGWSPLAPRTGAAETAEAESDAARPPEALSAPRPSGWHGGSRPGGIEAGLRGEVTLPRHPGLVPLLVVLVVLAALAALGLWMSAGESQPPVEMRAVPGAGGTVHVVGDAPTSVHLFAVEGGTVQWLGGRDPATSGSRVVARGLSLPAGATLYALTGTPDDLDGAQVALRATSTCANQPCATSTDAARAALEGATPESTQDVLVLALPLPPPTETP